MISRVFHLGTNHACSPIKHKAKVNANQTVVPDKLLYFGPTNSVAIIYNVRPTPP